MKKTVIVCGEAGYYYILGQVQRGELPLKDIIVNYVDNKIGYFHFRDKISSVDEEDILVVLNALYNSLHDGVKPQLNIVNY